MEAQDILLSIEGEEFLSSMFSSYKRAVELCINKRVLDFGCGFGWGAYLLSEKAAWVDAFDIDESRISFAKESFTRDNLCFYFGKKPVKGYYDVICAFQVLQYTDEIDDALEAMYESLKAGGSILISIKRNTGRALEVIESFAKAMGLVEESKREYYLSPLDSIIEMIFNKY